MKPYKIRISSQKGGVGKTTIAVNLATVLAQNGEKVLLIDGDTTNPSVGFHLGMQDVNIGFKDVLLNKVDLRSATVTHSITGMRVLPGTIYSRSYEPTTEQISRMSNRIDKENYTFVLIDTAPGFVPSETSRFVDEALIVTTPDMSSCTSSIRLSHLFDKQKLKHGLVVNRVTNKKYEIPVEEIEEMYGNKVSGVFPEDNVIPESISQHIPAYLLDRRSVFAKNMKEFGRLYATREEETSAHGFGGGGFFAFIRRLFKLGKR